MYVRRAFFLYSSIRHHVFGDMERGYLATAASTLRLVALMTAATWIVADPAFTPAGNFPPTSTNRCSDFHLSGFTNAMNCGSPLSSPCFDFNRCRESSPTVYVYDQEVGDVEGFLASPDHNLPNVVPTHNLAMIFRCIDISMPHVAKCTSKPTTRLMHGQRFQVLVRKENVGSRSYEPVRPTGIKLLPQTNIATHVPQASSVPYHLRMAVSSVCAGFG